MINRLNLIDCIFIAMFTVIVSIFMISSIDDSESKKETNDLIRISMDGHEFIKSRKSDSIFLHHPDCIKCMNK